MKYRIADRSKGSDESKVLGVPEQPKNSKIMQKIPIKPILFKCILDSF